MRRAVRGPSRSAQDHFSAMPRSGFVFALSSSQTDPQNADGTQSVPHSYPTITHRRAQRGLLCSSHKPHRHAFRRSREVRDPLWVRDVAIVELQLRTHHDAREDQLHFIGNQRGADAVTGATAERKEVMRWMTHLKEAIWIESRRLIPQIRTMKSYLKCVRAAAHL